MPLPTYNPSSPCFCFATCTPNPQACTTGDCFKLGTVVVSCENSVGPCDEIGVVSFDCFCYPCETPVFTVTNADQISGITINNLDKDGLTFKTDGTLSANDRVEICFKSVCQGDECDYQSDYGSVVIYIKDKCTGISCPDGEHCDKCTGDCVPNDLNLTTDPTAVGGTSSQGIKIG